MTVVRGVPALLRAFCLAALAVGLAFVSPAVGAVGKARAAGYESLMVPSAAMGRDIPVAFLAGGPHAVYLLTPSTRRPT